MQRIMKSLFLLLTLLALNSSTSLLAQTGHIQSLESLPYLKSSTTLVVLDSIALGETPYNIIIKNFIDQHWTISSTRYIPRDSLTDYLTDRRYSMLFKNDVLRAERRVKGTSFIRFNEIGVYLMTRNNLDNYRSSDAIAKILAVDIRDTATYQYKLGTLLKAMHLYLKDIQSQRLTKNNYEKKLNQYLNQYNALVPDYTLLVNVEELPDKIKSPKRIKRYYDFPVSLVSKDSIRTHVYQETEKMAILHIHPRNSGIQVIACEDGKILYAAKTSRYGRISPEDFISIVRAARDD